MNINKPVKLLCQITIIIICTILGLTFELKIKPIRQVYKSNWSNWEPMVNSFTWKERVSTELLILYCSCSIFIVIFYLILQPILIYYKKLSEEKIKIRQDSLSKELAIIQNQTQAIQVNSNQNDTKTSNETTNATGIPHTCVNTTQSNPESTSFLTSKNKAIPKIYTKLDQQTLLTFVLYMSFSISITFCLTNMTKVAIGRARPDFFNRCFMDKNLTDLNGIKDFVEGLPGKPELLETRCIRIIRTAPGWTAEKLQLNLKEGVDYTTKLKCQGKICYALIESSEFYEKDSVVIMNDKIYQDGYKSFFSGHSSYSSCACWIVTIFCLNYFKLLRCDSYGSDINEVQVSKIPTKNRETLIINNFEAEKANDLNKPAAKQNDTIHTCKRQHATSFIILIWIYIITNIILSIYITISRYLDYRHFMSDILVGYLVGFLISVISSFNFYSDFWR